MIKVGEFSVDDTDAREITVDCAWGSVVIGMNDDGIEINVFPLSVSDKPVAGLVVSREQLAANLSCPFCKASQAQVNMVEVSASRAPRRVECENCDRPFWI